MGDSYKPDRTGIIDHKPGETVRVGFDQGFDPVFGGALDLSVSEDVQRALGSDKSKKFLGLTKDDSKSHASATGDDLLAPDLDVSAWRWTGFTLSLPTALADTANDLVEFGEDIETVLKTLQAALEIIKALIPSSTNFLAAAIVTIGWK